MGKKNKVSEELTDCINGVNDFQFWIGVVLSVLLFISIIWVSVKNSDFLREQKRNDTTVFAFSFAKFQMFLWLIVVSIAVCIHWAIYECENEKLLSLGDTEIILLSIIGGVTITSRAVTNFHGREKEKAINQERLRAEGGTVNQTLPDPKSQIVKQDLPSSGNLFIDILRDDNGQISVVRLQQLIFTIIFVVVYITAFIGSKGKYPEFEDSAFILMGISGTSYLLGKGAKI